MKKSHELLDNHFFHFDGKLKHVSLWQHEITMQVTPIKTRIFLPGEDLLSFLYEHLKSLPEKSVIAVTSKIVALAENRVVEITNEEEKERLIKAESEIAFHHPYGWLSIRDGIMTGSAGIDSSNVGNNLSSLLPKDCFHSATMIRNALMKEYDLKELGVIITDSRLMPLRKGTLGAAFGYAGIQGLRSYIGTPDIYGRPFERQKLNIPDGLASAAVYVMGEGAEQQPIALLTDTGANFTNEPVDKTELTVPADDDIYYYFFRSIPEKDE